MPYQGTSLTGRTTDWLETLDFTDTLAAQAAFALAARRVGKASVSVPNRGRWGCDELVRARILIRAYPTLEPAGLWTRGDNRERQAVLKALPDLPDPSKWRSVALAGCRSNVLPIFESIACENAYPREQFTDQEFNQMVIKAAFSDVSLARIVGLATRRNAELTRMATALASERRAAGRPVPRDLGLAMDEAPCR